MCPPNTVSIACHIDLTVQDLAALEDNYHRKAIELSGTHVAKGYPDEKDLKGNKNLLHLYTGLSSFPVFMALKSLREEQLGIGNSRIFIHLLVKLWSRLVSLL